MLYFHIRSIGIWARNLFVKRNIKICNNLEEIQTSNVVCVCVCVCVCVFVCVCIMYVCMYVCVWYVCVCTRVSMSMSVCMHTIID